MTSKEIVRAVIRHQEPPRIAWDFYDKGYQDIAHMGGPRLISTYGQGCREWGDHPELSAKYHFRGETRIDVLGNVLGRFNGRTKGECIHGALEDDWDDLADYQVPTLDPMWKGSIPTDGADKYVLCGMPIGIFSALRDVRRIENALTDTLLETEMVQEFLKRVTDCLTACVRAAAASGADGIIFADDWGTQTAAFISPKSFRELFKPAYASIADTCHALGMDMMLHSCGRVQALVDDMIDAGIDTFQFDQPELSGVTYWAETYEDKASFYCPVDIQKVLPTGDRETIERAAKHMAETFAQHGGALIAKDYGGPSSWADINVAPEWIDWARDTIVKYSKI